MKVLVTGGAGYIGSHTCVEMLKQNYEVCIVDNLCNASPVVLDRIKEITGKEFDFFKVDIRDKSSLEEVFRSISFDAVVHFAGLKAVGESIQKPLMYYKNNVFGTLVLLELMQKYCVRKIVFSSSATVYGSENTAPFKENMPIGAINPYGRTKLIIEQVLKDICGCDKEFGAISLRYFNPIGAHKSGMIGEDPKGIPNNLMPYITQVSTGKLKKLSIFGNDYNTPDGTGIRDYIHVVDLALGHIKALKKLHDLKGEALYNLGTGKGYSVLDVVKSFEKATGIRIEYEFVPRRQGDIALCYAHVQKASDELGFVAGKDLYEMCLDSYRWQKKNPKGYD